MDAIASENHIDDGPDLPRRKPSWRTQANAERPPTGALSWRPRGRDPPRGPPRDSSPYFERVRWRCVPTDPKIDPHRLATTLPARHPRPTHPHSGDACPTCEHAHAGHEGPKTARGQHSSVAEAVAVLIGVGQGESLRERAA